MISERSPALAADTLTVSEAIRPTDSTGLWAAALGKLLSSLRRRFGRTGTRQLKRHLQNSQHIYVTNPWHAVGIVALKHGCRACSELKSARYLAKDAPVLPLKGCTQPQSCKCVYKHFSDRRLGPRRAAERLGFQTLRAAQAMAAASENRRHSSGRRCTDVHSSAHPAS